MRRKTLEIPTGTIVCRIQKEKPLPPPPQKKTKKRKKKKGMQFIVYYLLLPAKISGSAVDRLKHSGHYMYLTVVTIQGVPGGKDLTSGECSLGQTIPI